MRKTALKAADVEAELRRSSGNMAAVARALGVHRATVKRFIDQRPKLQAVALDLREGFKDNAESVLQSAVLAGEPWAVQFFLKTQAKDRGYTEKYQVEHGGILEIAERVIRTREEAAQAVSDMAEAERIS